MSTVTCILKLVSMEIIGDGRVYEAAEYIRDRVSWMRKRDLHILTSSIHTYTGDGRFSVMHPEQSDDWDLRIEYVQKRDAGVYECQINTEPKINMAVVLNVEDTSTLTGTFSSPMQPNYQRDTLANIVGSQDVYVKKGSTISLTCSVNVHSAPSSIQWYHGTLPVDFDSKRGGISLETEKTDTGLTSKLLITKAALSDSGNYTCVPSNSSPASVSVHVLIVKRRQKEGKGDVTNDMNVDRNDS
ncbi:defective proboscis extension response 7 [Carabus blaptoides fortunei]